MGKKHKRAVGLSPGTLSKTSENGNGKPVVITVMNYNEERLQEKKFTDIEQALAFVTPGNVCWINIDGIQRHDVIQRIGKQYNLHPLLLEDVSCSEQRPKLDDYEDHLFAVLKMLSYNHNASSIIVEQVSLILGENIVISFQEEGKEGDVFNPNRERIRGAKGKIRKSSADYLFYTLIDTIVDNYFLILESVGENVEELEDKLISDPTPDKLKALYTMKREMIHVRKSVWPLREILSRLDRGGSSLIKPTTHIFLRDVYDHTIQVIETVETYRDMMASMMDLYLSSISNKMNSIMKVLTIISTIFIPLTFVAGVYGMNFDYMPELKWKYGYPAVWIFMLIIVGLMLLYFRKKKWL